MKPPSYASFIRCEYFSNVFGVLVVPFLDEQFLDNKIQELGTLESVLLLIFAPLILGFIKSIILDNCSTQRGERDRNQERSNNIVYTTAALITHSFNLIGALTRNKPLVKFTQSALPVAAYAGGKAVDGARRLATSAANMWTQRRQQTRSSAASVCSDVESQSQEEAQETQPLLQSS